MLESFEIKYKKNTLKIGGTKEQCYYVKVSLHFLLKDSGIYKGVNYSDGCGMNILVYNSGVWHIDYSLGTLNGSIIHLDGVADIVQRGVYYNGLWEYRKIKTFLENCIKSNG